MSERQIKKQIKKESELRRLNRHAAIKSLLQSEQGRDFLWFLLEITKVGRQPFTANALTTSFCCGELNIGQQIVAQIIEADAAGYVRLLEEKHNGRRTRTDIPTGRDTDDTDDDSVRDPFGSELE